MALAYNSTPDNSTQYQNRVTANTYGEMPTTQAGSPTSAEAGGDGKFYTTRDEVSAGNQAGQHLNNRGVTSFTDNNYAASGAIADIHGKLIGDVYGSNYGPVSTGTVTTFINCSGGGAAIVNTSAFSYSRGGGSQIPNYEGQGNK